jgi:hypothetical protein
VFDLATGLEVRTLSGHTNRIGALAVSADGRVAVSAGLANDSAADDLSIRAWDVTTGKQLWKTDRGRLPLTALAVTADGGKAYFRNERWVDGTLAARTTEWDLRTGVERFAAMADVREAGVELGQVGVMGGFPRLTSGISPDGRWRVTPGAGPSGFAYPKVWVIRDARTNEVAFRVGINGTATHPEWFPDSSGFQLTDAFHWQVARVHVPAMTGRERVVTPVRVIAGAGGQRLEVSADGAVAWLGGGQLYRGGGVTKVDVTRTGLKDGDLHLSRDGKYFYKADPQEVAIYRVEDLTLVRRWAKPPETPGQLHKVYVGESAWATTRDGMSGRPRLVVWDILEGKTLWFTDAPLASNVAFSEDGGTMAALIRGEITAWRSATGEVLRRTALPEVHAPFGQAGDLALSGDARVAVLSYETAHHIVDLERGTLLKDVPSPSQPLLNRDGSLALAMGEEGDVYLLDTRKGRYIGHFTIEGRKLAAAAFGANGQILTTVEAPGGELAIWAVPTAAEMGVVAFPAQLKR